MNAWIKKWGQVDKAFFENNSMLPILSKLKDAIFAFHNDGRMIFCNEKFQEKFLTPLHLTPEDVSLPVFAEIEIYSDISEAIENIQKNGELVKIKNFHLPLNQRDLYYDITLVGLGEEILGNGQNGILGMCHNVTEKKLNAMMRTDFVANVSHELRTPLTSLKGYAQLLAGLEDHQSQIAKDAIEKILKHSKYMENLFTNLLQLSWIESQNKIKKIKIIFSDIFLNLESEIRDLYPHKVWTLSIQNGETEIEINQELMEQVFINLMDNSLKYNSKEKGRISINIYENTERNGFMIDYYDDGDAIAPGHLPRLFERFYRVDHSRSHSAVQFPRSHHTKSGQEVTGTGLGLAIVKHVLMLHRGKIWAENTGGHTHFMMFLPKASSKTT